MEKATYKFSQKLISRIYTTNTLKHISQALESLTQNPTFKSHANSIVEDANLSDTQKRTQLLYLIRSVDEPLLYDFLSDELTSSQFWLFTSDRIDYFDRFVQEFQNATEAVKVIYLSTAVPLNATDLQLISENFSTSFGYKVMVEHEHNPALIGGVQARIENLIVDHSLRTKFQHFQRHWLKSLESIESAIGRNEPDNLI